MYEGDRVRIGQDYVSITQDQERRRGVGRKMRLVTI